MVSAERNSFREELYEKHFLETSLPPGFFFSSAFKPPLLYLDGRNYCVYCVPLLSWDWGEHQKSLEISDLTAEECV